MEAEEEFEDTIGGSHDYADLASAMRQAGADSDQEEEDQDLSDVASDDDEEVLSDGEQVDSDGELVHLGSDESAGEGSSDDEEDAQGEGSSHDDDLNPFELAEGTESEDGEAQQGKCTLPGLHKSMLVCFVLSAV